MHTPLSRRTALKASGITVALPLLESMSMAIGGNNVAPPKRMVCICNTLGLHAPSLFPTTTGNNYESTEYLDILQRHRKEYTLFAGLSHPDQVGKDPHDTEMTFLTSARNPGLGGFRNTISIDQFAAEKIGNVTRYPSVSLSSNRKKSQSFTRNGVMIPADDMPSQVYTKLFLRGSQKEIRQQRQRLADGHSILDSVIEQIRSIERTTPSTDKHQLEQYFDSIRVAETELNNSEVWLDRPKPSVQTAPPENIADPSDLVGRVRSLLNLIPLILQTDSSRVISVVIQSDHGTPNIDGVSDGHHPLSHHGQDPERIAQLKIIEMEILMCLSNFLDGLKQPSENGSGLLEQTSVLFGSNLGNANAHDPRNLPIILAGGKHKHGRFIQHNKKDNVPLCNLFVSLLQSMGIESDQFGSSTGTLDI